MSAGLLRALHQCPKPQAQFLLPLDGSHPGPLFGPLAIKKLSKGCRRGKEYREKLRRATPPWADLAEIRNFYKEAERLTKLTGVRWSVDHRIPLGGETVCGLHVHTNMQVITKAQNVAKGNSFVDQPDLL